MGLLKKNLSFNVNLYLNQQEIVKTSNFDGRFCPRLAQHNEKKNINSTIMRDNKMVVGYVLNFLKHIRKIFQISFSLSIEL